MISVFTIYFKVFNADILLRIFITDSDYFSYFANIRIIRSCDVTCFETILGLNIAQIFAL
jgi:hypothetical protein